MKSLLSRISFMFFASHFLIYCGQEFQNTISHGPQTISTDVGTVVIPEETEENFLFSQILNSGTVGDEAIRKKLEETRIKVAKAGSVNTIIEIQDLDESISEVEVIFAAALSTESFDTTEFNQKVTLNQENLMFSVPNLTPNQDYKLKIIFKYSKNEDNSIVVAREISFSTTEYEDLEVTSI